MSEPTAVDERGRILGVMEPTTEIVDSLSFRLPMAESDFDLQGEYRWPYGLLNVRAWRVTGKPLLKVVSSRSFNMDAALGIVPLTDAEAGQAGQLALIPVPLLDPSPHAQRRVTRATGMRHVAPAPSTTRAGIMHMRTANASTYLMELVGAAEPSFKVGWAFDPANRARVFNHHSVPSIGGLKYRVRLEEPWKTAREAFRMEQAFLREFERKRHPHNNEILVGASINDLTRAWLRHVQSGRKR